MTGSEFRLHLQSKGYDGVKWTFKPEIDVATFNKTGRVNYRTPGGTIQQLVRTPDGFVDLNDEFGNNITGYESIEDFLNTNYDEEIYVAFRPEQIEIKKIIDLRKAPEPPEPRPGDPVPTFATPAQATEYFEKRYPHAKFDFGGIDTADGFLDNHTKELARLFDLYPETAERLKYVGTYKDKTKIADIATDGRFSKSEFAHCALSGQYIGLNPKWYGDAKAFRDKKKYNKQIGWSVTDADHGTVTHEFGHAVDAWLQIGIGNDFAVESYGPGVDMSIGTLQRKIIAAFKPTPGEQSDYSLAGKPGTQKAEQVAEGFSMLWNRPAAEHSRYAKALEKLIEIARRPRTDYRKARKFEDLTDAARKKAVKEINELMNELGLPPEFGKHEIR